MAATPPPTGSDRRPYRHFRPAGASPVRRLAAHSSALPRPRPLTIGATFGDRLGICLSGLCILHCALTPVLLVGLPALNLSGFPFPGGDFHVVIAVFIGCAALLAFIPGFRAHRNRQVFAWAIPGFLAIVLAAFLGKADVGFAHLGQAGEAALSIFGSVLLIRAHLLNRAYCACCRTHAAKLAAGDVSGLPSVF